MDIDSKEIPLDENQNIGITKIKSEISMMIKPKKDKKAKDSEKRSSKDSEKRSSKDSEKLLSNDSEKRLSKDSEKRPSKASKMKNDDIEKETATSKEESVDEIDIWSYQAVKILRASNLYDDEIKFEMKFKGLKTNQIVSANEAKIQCPQIVIAFYQKHLVFHKNS